MSEIQVVIADDEKLALDGASSVVEKMPGFCVAGKAMTGEQAYEEVQASKAEILLTDIRMPQKDGIWLINRLAQEGSHVTVIIVSAYDDKEYLRAAIRNPLVFDYLTKPFLSRTLTETLKAASDFHFHQDSQAGNEASLIAAVANCILRSDCTRALKLINQKYSNRTEPLPELQNNARLLVTNLCTSLYAQKDNYQVLMDMAAAIQQINASSSGKEVLTAIDEFVTSRSKGQEGIHVTALVNGCLSIMSTHLSDPSLSISIIASELGVTPNYLSSRFSRDMGVNFTTYLMYMRIHAAKDSLLNLQYKVYEIAEHSGFSDVGYFNRAFKEHTGLTPLQYREKAMAMLQKGKKGSDQEA